MREGVVSNRDVVGSPNGAPLASVDTQVGEGMLRGSGGTGESVVSETECFQKPEVKAYLAQVQSRTLERWVLPPERLRRPAGDAALQARRRRLRLERLPGARVGQRPRPLRRRRAALRVALPGHAGFGALPGARADRGDVQQSRCGLASRLCWALLAAGSRPPPPRRAPAPRSSSSTTTASRSPRSAPTPTRTAGPTRWSSTRTARPSAPSRTPTSTAASTSGSSTARTASPRARRSTPTATASATAGSSSRTACPATSSTTRTATASPTRPSTSRATSPRSWRRTPTSTAAPTAP